MINTQNIAIFLAILLLIFTALCLGNNNDLFQIMPTLNKFETGKEHASDIDAVHNRIGSRSYVVKGKKYQTITKSNAKNFTQIGIASWYGPGFHGKRTANGERYNQNAMTAAHKTLPLSTVVKVTNLENNKTVVVRINDRGPYYGNRILDLSKKAAQSLGISHRGTAKIKLQVLS